MFETFDARQTVAYDVSRWAKTWIYVCINKQIQHLCFTNSTVNNIRLKQYHIWLNYLKSTPNTLCIIAIKLVTYDSFHRILVITAVSFTLTVYSDILSVKYMCTNVTLHYILLYIKIVREPVSVLEPKQLVGYLSGLVLEDVWCIHLWELAY